MHDGSDPSAGDHTRWSSRPIPALVILLAAQLILVASAQATRTATLDLDTLLYRSALIFEGVVIEVDVTAGVNQGAAATRVDFRVDAVLKGTADSKLTFRLPEGVTPDGRLVETVETPRFMAGERYLVFVRGGKWRFSPVADWSQGSLRVTDVGGHRVMVTDSGHCIADMDRRRLHPGPRVAPRLQWPGFPTTTGADPPRPDRASRCASPDDIGRRLVARIGELGHDSAALERVHLTPRDDVSYTPTAPPHTP